MISLDVFDTAIFRDVYEPRDIFTLVENKVGNDFRKRRVEAENKASQIRFYTLKDIYNYLPEFNPNIEIQMELEHCYANKEILDLYNSNPQNFIFISDMYLPSDIIARMLKKCGYQNPKVFVSCEEKCNKGSGLLFKKVERKLGKITKHYGDNYRSDIEGCVKEDIQPVFKQALHKMPLNLPAVKNPLLKKYAALLETSKEEAITKLCKWYAPLVYEFTKWVVSQRKEGQSIYFLSRDMFIPYLIATKILEEKDVNYLYCSRRSLAPLFIKSGQKPLIDKMRIVLKEEEYKQKSRSIDECMKYLKSTGIKDGDILVDIGYSGSTQCILEKFLNIKLKGLYIQLDQALNTTMDMSMFLNRYALTYRFLAEFILTSPEDCVEDYKDGKVIMTPDHEKRKEYARQFTKILVDEKLFNEINEMNLSVYDIEQMLIHIQNYPSIEMMNLFNEPILTNREKVERGINFDREAIKKGKLMECFKKSYARPLLKRMLEMDEELSSLVKLLP